MSANFLFFPKAEKELPKECNNNKPKIKSNADLCLVLHHRNIVIIIIIIIIANANALMLLRDEADLPNETRPIELTIRKLMPDNYRQRLFVR